MKLSDLSELVDKAEECRQQGQIREALETVERALQKQPDHPRALLVLGRILYLSGNPHQTFKALDSLKSILGINEELRRIFEGLMELWRMPESPTDTTFATETMGDLYLRQGYYWEAVEIYRQLYLASTGDDRLWQRILNLRDHLTREVSRKTPEHFSERLESLNLWIQIQQRGL